MNAQQLHSALNKHLNMVSINLQLKYLIEVTSLLMLLVEKHGVGGVSGRVGCRVGGLPHTRV